MPADGAPSPVFLSSEPELVPAGPVRADQVKGLVLDHVFEPRRATAATARESLGSPEVEAAP